MWIDLDKPDRLMCEGWTEDRTELGTALYRFGYATTFGDAWRLADSAELRHRVVCADDDEEEREDCDEDAEVRPVTFAVFTPLHTE